MSEDSDRGPNIVVLIVVFFALVVCGFFAYSYFNHTGVVLKICLMFSSLVTLFSLFVMYQVGGSWDRRWWVCLGVPFIIAFTGFLLALSVKFQLDKEIVTRVQGITTQHQFSFSDVLPNQPAMKFAHFVGLVCIIFSQGFCGFVFASRYLKEVREYSHPILDFHERLVLAMIFLWLIAAILILS
jgi:hypothetical protein